MKSRIDVEHNVGNTEGGDVKILIFLFTQFLFTSSGRYISNRHLGVPPALRVQKACLEGQEVFKGYVVPLSSLEQETRLEAGAETLMSNKGDLLSRCSMWG